MARIVSFDAEGPIEVKPQDCSVWICACGLTGTPPFCDGSHKQSRSEKVGRVYEYVDGDTRRCVRIEPDRDGDAGADGEG